MTDKLVYTSVFVVALFSAQAALAGEITPAPVAGLGIGAVIALGVGYRLLRKRISR